MISQVLLQVYKFPCASGFTPKTHSWEKKYSSIPVSNNSYRDCEFRVPLISDSSSTSESRTHPKVSTYYTKEITCLNRGQK